MDKNEMNPPRRFYIKDTDLSERRMERCGLCSLISSMLRRAMCVSSRRGSSESYYRELGDQDTLKIDDRSSEYSYNAEAEFETRPEFPTCPRTYELEKMKPKSLADSKFLTIHKRRKKRLLTRSLQKNRALLDDLLLGQVECILSQSALWKFNAFTLDVVSGGRCLPVLCVHLFQEYGLMSHFNLDAAKAWKLFSLIEEGYHSTNPYHNAIHAADVTQAMHCFLQQPRIRKNLKPIEIMASLLAAIAHDLDHPGVNQPFLIATSNHLASLYNNTSVLENHHWRSAISCLYESGLLNHMGEAWPQLEQQISSLILATDITKQHEYLSQFKSHLDMNSLDMQSAKHRHLVLQIALKCADISNPCRPWQISRKWSLKVCEEFFRQGDYERKLNLPVTALCDRHTTSIPKIQAGFFKFVVTPLIKEWDRFLNNDLSSQMFENLVYNQNKWDTLVAQEQAEETHTEISDADIVDDIASDTNISDSSELLLPPRRSSLNAVKQVSLKDQLRRFSVPLNVFQDSKFKSKAEKIQISIVVEPQKVAVDSPAGSEHSIHSQLSVGEQCEHVRETPDKFLSSEKLMPDTSIASITTSAQATRLNTVIKDSGTWKLVRQQTFPPLETRDHSLKSRSLHTSKEDAIHASRLRVDLPKLDIGAYWKEGTFRTSITKVHVDKTEVVPGTSESYNLEPFDLPRSTRKESQPKRRESIAAGSQLRDNLTSVQLAGLGCDPMLRRRKSMPAEVGVFVTKEKKVREISAVLPQFLHRTLSTKESWTRRRGSAPSPIAVSELCGLAAKDALKHSSGNGGRRKPSPVVTCPHWLAKTTYTLQEKAFPSMFRRSSLPAEVITGYNDDREYDADVDDVDDDDAEEKASDEIKPKNPEIQNPEKLQQDGSDVYLEDPENDPVDDEISEIVEDELYWQPNDLANLPTLRDRDLDLNLDHDLDTDTDETLDTTSSSDTNATPLTKRRPNSI